MPLKDLNEDLYSQAPKISPSHAHEKSEYDPDIAASQVSASPFDEEQVWNKPQKGLTQKQKKIAIIAGSIFGAVVLIVAGFFFFRWWRSNAFHQDRVEINIEGPKEADSTQLNKYVIHYKNNNRVILKNAEIRLTYAENFQPIDNVNLKILSPGSSKIFIGDVGPKDEGTVDLTGVFYAPKDFPVYLYASIVFVPSNSEEEFSMENQIGVNITASPVSLNVLAPEQTIDGYDMSYVVDYENIDSLKMSDMQLRVSFPEGFKMDSSQPSPAEESIWQIGNLNENQGGNITIKGQIFGVDGEEKNAIFSLGRVGTDGNFVVFSRQETNTKVVLPVLSIKQGLETLEGDFEKVISAGDVLKYVISYKNTSTVGLRDAIITAEVKGKVLDFSKIRLDKGFYDEKTGIITWKASDIPALANIGAQSTGEVRFSIPVKSTIPVESKEDKNFIVSSIAKIDSPDIPVKDGNKKVIGSNKLELKLASKVLFDTTAYFKDLRIKNTGPIPMRVGTETTFAVHWKITNVSNDIKNAKVVASLPTGIKWKGKIFRTDERITYNERTNQIIWSAGDIKAGAGISGPAREVIFQVGVVPQTNQAGEPVLLIKESTFTARDSFVEKDLTIQGAKKDTQLYEDKTVGAANGKVSLQKTLQ